MLDQNQHQARLFFTEPELFKVTEALIPKFQIELKNRYEILKTLEDQNRGEINDLNENIINPLNEVAKKCKLRTPKGHVSSSNTPKTSWENKEI